MTSALRLTGSLDAVPQHARMRQQYQTDPGVRLPRIRSIKPEFWTDGDMLRQSDSCRLFFIALWNFCDDEGKHRLDFDQLKAELGSSWDKGKLRLFVTRLTKSGQLSISSCSGWLRVNGWFHQKIDKPRQPVVKSADLQWLNEIDSSNVLESSRTIDARIGSDRILPDRIGSSSTGVNPDGTDLVLSKSKSDSSKNIPTWEAYREAYKRRYGEPPIRNASVNSKIAQIVNRLGVDEAPLVAEFFLTHNDAFYVKAMHGIGLLLRDAEKLRTEWATGQKMLGANAREVERMQYSSNSWDEAARIVNDRRAGHEAK